MPSALPCPSCERPNESGARFCVFCGKNLEPQQHCPACGAAEPVSNQFCSQCGGELGPSAWRPGRDVGSVTDGVWARGADEFVRRVEPDECRTFLGSRTMVVPAGTVGLIVVDGVVQEVLPPGLRTTTSVFERITNFFTGAGARTALFLVDQRPIPVPFVVTTRPTSDGRQIQTQVLVTFFLPRGDRDRMGTFLSAVLGPRVALAAADLYDLLRPEVTRAATSALERLANGSAGGAFGYPEAEGVIRDALEGALGPRYGLSVSVTVAPLTTTASVNVSLGQGQAPRVRPCASCKQELPAALTFCDHCGTRQPALLSPERTCKACDSNVPDGDGFCNQCGAAFTPPPATYSPLFTRDGEQVEVDLVIRVQGQHADLTADRLGSALVGAATSYLRSVDFSALARGAGFSAMEAAMKPACDTALAAFGLTLGAISVLDLRSKKGAWLLGARADLARATDELGLSRDWLTQRAAGIDVQALALAQGLREQEVGRDAKLTALASELGAGRREAALRTDDAFERDQASLADREQRERLAGVGAALDVSAAKRDAERARAVASAQRTVEQDRLGHERQVESETLDHQMGKEWRTFEHESGLTRGALELEAERKRQAVALESEAARKAAEDAAFAARARQDASFEDHTRRAELELKLEAERQAQQLTKLREMAELDKAIAAQEAAREQARIAALRGLDAREALALQAVELAKSDGGAAFAEALGQLGGAAAESQRREDAERHAADLRAVLEAQLDRTTRLAEGAAGGAASERLYAQSMESMSRVSASRAAPSPIAGVVPVSGVVPSAADDTVPCPNCAASMRRGAKFCGACGKSS